MGKENRNLLILLFLINFMVTAGYAVSDSFFPVLFRGILGRGIGLSLAFGLYSVSKVAFGSVTGRLLNRYGEIKLLGASLLIYALVSIMFIVFSDSQAVIIARILQGAACAVFRPVIYAVVGGRAPKDRIGRISGFMDVSFYLALAAGPFFGGYILSFYGKNGVLFCLSALCFFALVLFFLWVVNKGYAGGYMYNAEETGSRSTGGAVFSGLLIYIFFRAWSISAVSIYLPLFMTESGFSPTDIGMAAGSLAAVTAVSLIFTGRLSDIGNRCVLLSTGGIVSALMIICMPAVHDAWLMTAAASVSGFFSAVSQPAGVSLLIEQTRQEGSGQALAQFNLVMNLGFIFSPLINAGILSLFGINAVFIISGLLVIGAVCIFMLMSTQSLREGYAKC